MKVEDSDNSIAYMVAFCVAMVVCFLLVWIYAKPAPDPAMNTSFAAFGPISLQSKEFTMRTSVALQSLPENNAEISKNKNAMTNFLQVTLENADPALLGSRDVKKFSQLQQMLTEAVNSKFPQAKVQKVWITDFVTSPD